MISPLDSINCLEESKNDYFDAIKNSFKQRDKQLAVVAWLKNSSEIVDCPEGENANRKIKL